MCLVLVLILAMSSVIRTSLSLSCKVVAHTLMSMLLAMSLCVSKKQLVYWTSEVRAGSQFCCISACLLHVNFFTTSSELQNWG